MGAILDVLIVAAIAVLTLLAVLWLRRHKGVCGGGCGCCSMAENCEKRKKREDKQE